MSGGGGSIDMLSCANCGIGEENSNILKKCSACMSVKYCSAACQTAHRPQHKQACKKRAAELHDEKLFKDPPSPDECPICFLPLPPIELSEASFQTCCGKTICNGCIHAMQMSEGGVDLCAFCRAPPASLEKEEIKRLNKLMNNGSADACNMLAYAYATGTNNLPQDYQKANELYLKAGELGCAAAYYNLGIHYNQGRGVEVDKKKAKYYYELAAMKGGVDARHNLGVVEWNSGNLLRAMKHFIMAAKAGDETSLDHVKQGFINGVVTKDEYAKTLRSYQKSLDEMKSDAREKAAASIK